MGVRPADIAAAIQRITADVRVDGSAVSGLVEITTDSGFDQANAQAKITLLSRPSRATEGKSVEIWAGYNSGMDMVFRGEIAGVTWEDNPTQTPIDCRDMLARTRLAWQGDDVEEYNIDSAAMVRHILEIYGIPSSSAHIEGSGWTLGTINPVTLKKGETGFSLIQRLDDLEGYKTFTDPTGVIRRMRVSGVAGSGAALSIGPGQLIERPRRIRTSDGIINACVVTGLDIEGITVGGEGVADVRVPNPYVPDPPGYVGPHIQDDLIEDDETALAIAARTVSDGNRRPEGLELTIVGDPRIQPGMTIAVSESGLEIDTVNVVVIHVSHRITPTSFTTVLRTTGGNLSGYLGGIPPTPIFDVQTFLEGEDTGSGVDGLIVGVADGSQSYDADGTIASYAWTASGTSGTPTPDSGSSPIFRFTIPATATDITLTLTVTDNDGLTGVLERIISLAKASLLVEDLYTAEGSTVACSSDGEQTWREATPASGNATCLAPFAPAWGQAWGTDSGHVYATFDKLVSPLVDLGQPHGATACTAVWVHEVEQTRLWAGFADGDVWQATVDPVAQTATWTRAGATPEGPIRELRETLAAFGDLRATAGAGYYGSTNAGVSWSLLHTFDTAWRMAAGFDLNLASGLNSTPPLFAEEGSAPTVPGGTTHIRGLTFGWRTKALYAADDGANLLATDDTLASLTDTGDDALAGVNHMIRSGNLDGPIIYMACGDGTGDNGAAKWIPETKAPFWIRRSGSRPTYMVAYGPAHPPPIAVQLLMVGSHDGIGVRRWQLGTWLDVTGDLPSDIALRGIVANPVAPLTDWICWGVSTAYRTLDGGNTWTQLTNIAPTIPSLDTLDSGITGIAYKADGSQWAAVGGGENAFLIRNYGFVCFGSGTAGTSNTVWDAGGFEHPAERGIPRAVVWVESSVIVAIDRVEDLNGPSWTRYPGGATVATGDSCRAGALDRYRDRAVLGIGIGLAEDEGELREFHQLWRVDDALSGAAAPLVELSGATTAAVAGEYAFAANVIRYPAPPHDIIPNTGGLIQVNVHTGGDQVLIVDGEGLFVRSDQASHVAAAAIVTPLSTATTSLSIFDGSSWSHNIALPGTLFDFATYVEVIAI